MNRRMFYFLQERSRTAGADDGRRRWRGRPHRDATVTPGRAGPSGRPRGSPGCDRSGRAGTGYAGEATCLGCHDQAYKGTAHGRSFNERAPAANLGCENCHGPGKAHADSGDPTLIRRFTAISPSEVNATCTSCHNRATHALGRQPARAAESELHQLPQRPRGKGRPC